MSVQFTCVMRVCWGCLPSIRIWGPGNRTLNSFKASVKLITILPKESFVWIGFPINDSYNMILLSFSLFSRLVDRHFIKRGLRNHNVNVSEVGYIPYFIMDLHMFERLVYFYKMQIIWETLMIRINDDFLQ